MIITTTETIPGCEVLEIRGIARGNTMVSLQYTKKGVMKDVIERQRGMMDALAQHAEKLGGNAVISTRFDGTLVYGTAVLVRPYQ